MNYWETLIFLYKSNPFFRSYTEELGQPLELPTVQGFDLAGVAVGRLPLPNGCVVKIVLAHRSKVLGTVLAMHKY